LLLYDHGLWAWWHVNLPSLLLQVLDQLCVLPRTCLLPRGDDRHNETLLNRLRCMAGLLQLHGLFCL
jgi:hypothetical protein